MRHLALGPAFVLFPPGSDHRWIGSLVTYRLARMRASAGLLSPGLNQDRSYRPNAYRAAVLMSEPDSPVPPHFIEVISLHRLTSQPAQCSGLAIVIPRPLQTVWLPGTCCRGWGFCGCLRLTMPLGWPGSGPSTASSAGGGRPCGWGGRCAHYRPGQVLSRVGPTGPFELGPWRPLELPSPP